MKFLCTGYVKVVEDNIMFRNKQVKNKKNAKRKHAVVDFCLFEKVYLST